ncbi:MAG TPA: hypothetical protein EYP81_04975 [Thermodesulfobacteriaceae bacterium]|nr:hypothetical protein [Thermodesulfobacteriaceae bacterium]
MLRVIDQGTEFYFLPVLHGNLEFAQAVHQKLTEIAPEAVAVEYPPTLSEAILRGVKRLPYLSVITYQEQDGTEVYLIVEPVEPLIEAVRFAIEKGIPVFFVDLDLEGYTGRKDPFPDTYLVYRLGYERYVEEVLKHEFQRLPQDESRELAMAYGLKKLSGRFSKVAFVGGLVHIKPVAETLKRPSLPTPFARTHREGIKLFHLSFEGSREVLSEVGFLQGAYEKARREGHLPLDRLRLHEDLLAKTCKAYEREFQEKMSPRDLSVFRQFARNYALLSARLTPDFYQLLVAARGVGGDDFAWHLWEIGTRYPYQQDVPDLVPLDLRLEDLMKPHKKIRFFRRMKPLHRKRLVPIKKRPTERRYGEWKETWRGGYICSFPPEDIVIENFGREVMRRALRVISEELKRVEPFTVSMKDGPDIRETIRRWHEGRIYVVDAPVATGKAGSVVVIFDEDSPEVEGRERYPWKLTWHGEHDQESDMAFYATPPGEVMVGPGISRCTYGGFMLTYPPMRVYDIWEDPYFDFARTKAEKLLLAAIDYSLERYVVYVARRPPTALARNFAAKQGKKVIYLPLGSFSPILLHRIRTFHVLEGHHVREYADKYINPPSGKV